MAAIKPGSAALAALTSAALSLPGLGQAAVPVAEAEGNVQYGHYQESGNRITVDVYHGDFVLPLNDRIEFTFSIDRDTYSGASPAYSLPETMTNQLQYKQKADGGSASTPTPGDVVSAASGGVTSQGLTQLGGLNTFKSWQDGKQAASKAVESTIEAERAQYQAQLDAERAQYLANNPMPPGPVPPPSIPGPVELGFQSMVFSSYAGKPNLAPLPSGQCSGTASVGCYYEGGMAVGIAEDTSNPIAHLHRVGSSSNRMLGYHSDSSGIYMRAVDSAAFNLKSMNFAAAISSDNPNVGANALWEILGFNTALNPGLSSGDGTNYATRVAYQTVANGYNGVLSLEQAFQNINAFWIHYKGYPQTPTDGTQFSMQLDNVKLDSAVTSTDKTPEQIAWENAYNAYNQSLLQRSEAQGKELAAREKELEKQYAIALYRDLLNSYVPGKTKIVQKYQQQPLETRTMPVFGLKYYFDNALLAMTGGYSDEPDFKSNFGSLKLSREFNDKHTTVSLGYNVSDNSISRNGPSHGTAHGTDAGHDNPAIYPTLDETSTFQSATVGFTQVLAKNTLLQVSGTYTNQGGYLSNPYKYVYVRGEITPEEYYYLWQAPSDTVDWKSITNLEVVGTELFREVRPRLRNQGSVSFGINQHVPELDASLNADYRYFADDWGIDSHTFELKWYQPLTHGIMISPGIRYYSQSEADFFAPYFLAPRADGYYSSDFRLSSYGALSGGITVSKKFSKGISIQAGFEYYTHAGGLKLGGGGTDAYADFSYFMAHAGLNFNLSAPGVAGDGPSHHAHHQHHGAPLPAGIMFGHMLSQADDIMVGYRYQYSNQGGDMLRGSSTVSDRALGLSGCAGLICYSKPTDMTMHMHMFDFMYAPTDWLNLMVMPQLMDMSMSLVNLPWASADDAHGGGHNSNGIGDTVMTALVKMFEAPGHHVHVGIGLSAPTGSTSVTLDGRTGDGTVLQDYGMQLGSGTWDFKPSLTYAGFHDDWSWGLQLSGIKRIEGRNNSGYALGDQFQSTAWGGYSFYDWLSATVRGSYTILGRISGEFNDTHPITAPVDFPSNYGGRFWDIGVGVSLAAPPGEYFGHTLSVEWLQPVNDDFNGYQLRRNGSLSAVWSYMF